MSTIIKMEHITKHYSQGTLMVPALIDVDFSLQTNDFTALTGPSGSGKSTLLNLCGLIDSPSSGKLIFCGNDVAKSDELTLCDLRRKKLGFVFQGFNLIPVMSVYDNVEYPLSLLNYSCDERAEKTLTMLEAVGLSEFSHHLPDQISGGQKQRVAIARALVTEPKLVIADEPTANLDSHTANGIIQLMQRMHEQSGTSFIIATHDERMSSQCKTIHQLNDGVLQ